MLIWMVLSQKWKNRSFSVTCECFSHSGDDISITFRIRLALVASSRVDLNASTRLCGNLLMKPTVSIKITFLPSGSSRPLEVVSRVAKSLFSAKTSEPVSLFSKVDFPAFVYPTIATQSTPSFFFTLCQPFLDTFVKNFISIRF